MKYSAFIRTSVILAYVSISTDRLLTFSINAKRLSSYAESRGIFVFLELRSKLQTDIVDYEHGFPVCWCACTRQKNFDWTKTRESTYRRSSRLYPVKLRFASVFTHNPLRRRVIAWPTSYAPGSCEKEPGIFFQPVVRYSCPVSSKFAGPFRIQGS